MRFLALNCNRQTQTDHTATYYKGGTRKGVMKKKLGYKNKAKHRTKKVENEHLFYFHVANNTSAAKEQGGLTDSIVLPNHHQTMNVCSLLIAADKV